MMFRISWAADPCRIGMVCFRLRMVLSCQINYQKFGESIFGIRDRLIEFRKKKYFLPFRVSGTLKPVEYAGKNRFLKY